MIQQSSRAMGEADVRASRVPPPRAWSWQGEFTDRLRRLTRCEYEVMRLLLTGRSTKQVAIDLARSVKTIETHRTRVLSKMGVSSPVGLVRLIGQASGHPMPEDCLPSSHDELFGRSNGSRP